MGQKPPKNGLFRDLPKSDSQNGHFFPKSTFFSKNFDSLRRLSTYPQAFGNALQNLPKKSIYGKPIVSHTQPLSEKCLTPLPDISKYVDRQNRMPEALFFCKLQNTLSNIRFWRFFCKKVARKSTKIAKKGHFTAIWPAKRIFEVKKCPFFSENASEKKVPFSVHCRFKKVAASCGAYQKKPRISHCLHALKIRPVRG